MFRLPAALYEQLVKLKQRDRRPMTVEIQIALEEYLTKKGLWPPGEPDAD
jgi:hypothetical protein